jgi:type IX secretion system PorP/SprF family membrane protein
MKKQYLLYLIPLLLFSLRGEAQSELHYGMYMMHQPFFNPASASSYKQLTAAVVYKNQWTGYDGAPTIGAFNIVKPFKSSTLGLTITNDQVGVDNNTQISGSYAYQLELRGYSRLAFGLSASVSLLQSDLGQVSLLDESDPTYSGGNTGIVTQPNFKFGTYYYTNKFYAGIAIPNILDNRISLTDGAASTGFDFKSIHYYFHAGYRYELNKKADLNASTFLKQVSGASMQYDINLQYEYMRKYGVGLSYRSSKEILGIVSYQLTSELKMAYAYEFNLGEIGSYSSGSHEIMLIYKFSPPQESIISIPRF